MNKVEKMAMKTADGVAANVAALKELFPEVVSEGKVDFDALKTLMGGEVVGDERYQFTWAGKRAAMIEAAKPITKTLRPCPEESKDWDTTKNIYIEGDNLDALKILQNTYAGKVKMIYIDPPYNTGHDFIYHDNFHGTKQEELIKEGAVDDETGERFKRNPDSNGYFHSDWCSMIYPRLKLARQLLCDDGVIFISIDDNEVKNIREIGNAIFGENNFIAQIIVDATPKNDPYVVSTAHEYCLVYCRNVDAIKLANYGVRNPLYGNILKIYASGGRDYAKVEESLRSFYKENGLMNDNIANYKYADVKGVYRTGPIDDPQGGGAKDERINPRTGKPCLTPNSGWRCNLDTWEQWKKEGLIMFPESDDVLPSKKTYITVDRLDVMRAYFKMQTRKDTDALKNLFGLETTPFSNPKPVELIRTFIENCNDKDMVVADFFSGSGTTFHAVLEQNALDAGTRKAIVVQLPETIEESPGQSNKEKKIARSAIKFRVLGKIRKGCGVRAA